MKTLITVLFLFVSANTFAQPPQDFSSLLEKYLSCAVDCEKIFTNQELLTDFPKKNALSTEVFNQLISAADEQTRVWADTVLEGPYAADGNTRLDSVEGLYHEGSLFAYRITYSQKAWYVDGCQIEDEDYEGDSEREACTEGRISESAFVSADFKDVETDYDHVADFED